MQPAPNEDEISEQRLSACRKLKSRRPTDFRHFTELIDLDFAL